MQVLDVERKSDLLKKFQVLQSLKEKLDFWNKRLPVNFIAYHELGTEEHELYNNLHTFYIQVNDSDKKEFAKWVLNNYHNLSKKQNPYKELLDFDQLKKSFERKLEDSGDKLEAIRKELKIIRKEVTPPLPSSGGGFMKNAFAYASLLNKFNADYSTFEDYRQHSLSPDYQEVSANIYSILRAENGYTIGKYWRYLEELEKELVEFTEIKQATLDQKLLVLYYFGALKEIMKAENATKQAYFLNKVIGNDQEKIRQRFSSINDLISTPKESGKRKKLKEDLTEIQEIFQELGLQNIVKKIRTDLRKLSQ